MPRKTLAFLAAAALSAVCAAQTASTTPAEKPVAAAEGKVSGVLTCARPDPMHKVDAPDWPGHSVTATRMPCTWTRALEIAGETTKEGYSIGAADVEGTVSTDRGSHVTTMSNGDRIFVAWRGKGVLYNGAPQSAEGTWTFKGGNGKFARLQGMGTYRGKSNPDGSVAFDIVGSYRIVD